LHTKFSRHGDLTARICATLAYVKEEASQDTRNCSAGIILFSRGRNGLVVLADNGYGDDDNGNSKKRRRQSNGSMNKLCQLQQHPNNYRFKKK